MKKIDIVEMHIIAAIQLIAIEANPYSIHLVVMTADEMILSLADAENITLHMDARGKIKAEHAKVLKDLRGGSYKYFKRADKDPYEPFARIAFDKLSRLNEIALTVNIANFIMLAAIESEAMRAYFGYMLVKYKDLFFMDELSALMPDLEKSYGDFRYISESAYLTSSLRCLLMSEGLLPA